MTKDSPTDKWSPIFTVLFREPELFEQFAGRLRYNHQAQKQAADLADAVAAARAESTLKRGSHPQTVELPSRLASPSMASAMTEALALSPAQDEALRLAVRLQIQGCAKQAIVRQSYDQNFSTTWMQSRKQ